MRINKFIAQVTGLSRRAVDTAVADKRVSINGLPATLGQEVSEADAVTLDAKPITPASVTTTIMLNKPAGYVVSRTGQGSRTVYELLPPELQHLKPVGRLDKDSSGLLLLTNDGQLAHELTHPKFTKEKVYEVTLNKPLAATDQSSIQRGIQLEDGLSTLRLSGKGIAWIVTMHEGRNRQIRRTFEAGGYRVVKLRRIQFGDYKLGTLTSGQVQAVDYSA